MIEVNITKIDDKDFSDGMKEVSLAPTITFKYVPYYGALHFAATTPPNIIFISTAGFTVGPM